MPAGRLMGEKRKDLLIMNYYKGITFDDWNELDNKIQKYLPKLKNNTQKIIKGVINSFKASLKS
jgi:hypothetical protein